MELYFLASGVKHDMEYFEKEMQFMPFMLPYEKDGKKLKQPIYAMLSEMKLFRFIFPKEYMDEVLNTLNLPNKAYPMFDLQTAAMRKILRAKKIPKPKTSLKRFVGFKNIGIKGIGIKEDKMMTFPNGCTHEGI